MKHLDSGLPGDVDAAPVAGPGFSPEQAEALVRLIEASPAVQRRHQFFVWSQSQLQPLLPHQLLICGAYQRQRRALVFDAFQNVVLSAGLLQALTDGEGALQAAVLAAWLAGRGRPCALPLAALQGAAGQVAQQLQQELHCSHLLVHGVSRPQRPSELETLFVLAGAGVLPDGQRALRLALLELVLPQLHSNWQRSAATELALRALGLPAAPPRPPPAADRALRGSRLPVTPREQQILRWVREGLSNHQIGQVLGISPLTVKNHIQKILRKLHAGNRAQAVAQALAQHLIDAAEPPAHAAPARPAGASAEGPDDEPAGEPAAAP